MNTKSMIVSFISLLNFACSLPKVSQDAPTKYYGTTISFEKNSLSGKLNNNVQVLSKDARQLLRKGVRIAFFPPDSCRNTTAAPEGASQQGMIEMSCGNQMSTLETNVALAGYEVVSWQALKPNQGTQGAGGRTVDRAKELGVDVLFEIDQLSINDRGKGQTQMTGVSTFEQSTVNNRTPLAVTNDIGMRCKSVADTVSSSLADKIDLIEYSATFAAKAVDVKTGRAIWYYQKTITDKKDEDNSGYRYDLYYPAPPIYENVRSEQNWQQSLGTFFTVIGGIMTYGGGIGSGIYFITGVDKMEDCEDDYDTCQSEIQDDKDTKDLLNSTFKWGLISLTAGIALIIWGNNLQPADLKAPYSYPTPDNILCAVTNVKNPFETPRATVVIADSKESNFQFQSQSAAPEDIKRQRKERLTRVTTEDFLQELNALVDGIKSK